MSMPMIDLRAVIMGYFDVHVNGATGTKEISCFEVSHTAEETMDRRHFEHLNQIVLPALRSTINQGSYQVRFHLGHRHMVIVNARNEDDYYIIREGNRCFYPECSAIDRVLTPSGRSSFKRCANCRAISYCSRDCQRNHWPVHKVECGMGLYTGRRIRLL
jgi:hypothetical protein